MNFRRSGRPADRDETDQLLDAARAGTPTGPDADPANPLAELLGAAAAPTRPHELAGEQAALAAFRAARAAASATSTRAPRRRRFTAGAVAWAAAALATATAGAAFAAVNLDRPPDFVPPPGPETSSPITDGPDSSPTGGNTTSSPGSSPTAAPSPGTTGPTASPEQTTQLSELCRVYLAAKPAQREEALQTRRFAPLVAAAGGAGKVKGYCQRIARETGPRGENEPGAGNGPGTGKGSDAGKKPEATAKPSRPVREQPSHPAAGGRPTDAAGDPPTAGRLLVRRAVGLGILDQEDEQPYIDIRLGRRPIEPAAARLGITVDALRMRLGRIDTRLADTLAAGLLTGVTSQQAADELAHQAGHRLATRTGRASARGVTPFLAGMATLTRSPDATWSPGSLVRGWPSVSLGPCAAVDQMWVPFRRSWGGRRAAESYSLLPVWRRKRSWDAVDWSAVQHAYGPAVEVPDLLGRLRSRDREARRSAYQGLMKLLVHQGSRYEASAVATPFLVEIVADPKAPDRFAACQVLAAIAVGDESSWLIDRPDVANARREVERQGHLTRVQLEREQAEWAAAGSTDHERRARARRNEFSDVESDRDAARWQIAAYDATRAGVPAYIAALASPEPPVRLHAAHLLAWFPEERESIAPALARLIGSEPEPVVAAVACVAAGLCGSVDNSELVNALSARRGSDNRGERWSAVLGLARLVSRPDRPLIEELYACLSGAVGPVPYWPFLHGDMATFAALTVRDLDPSFAPDRVQILIDRLNAPADDTDRYLLMRAALDTAFPNGPVADGTAFTELSDDQRTAVAGLQGSGILNDGMMVSMLLGAYNLPGDETAMTRWCDSGADR